MSVIWKLLTKRCTSIVLIPCVVSLVLTSYIVRSVSLTHMVYGARSEIAAIIISLLWLCAFFIDQKRIYDSCQNTCVCIKAPAVLVLLSGLFIGLYAASAVWGKGYLSLAPLEKIDNGTQHLDSLFHSSVAESYRHFPYASTLLNGEAFLKYHTFSHLLMGIVSWVMGMPSLVAYCFLYPSVFLPLYFLAILIAVSYAKNYFNGRGEVNFTDVAVIMLFIAGGISASVLNRYGIWKTSYILSESFLVANTLAFFSYGLFFRALKASGSRTQIRMLLLIVIPFLVFVITWSKISVGFLFTLSTVYFVLRKGMKNWKYWIVIVVNCLVFMVALFLFNWSGTSAGNGLFSSIKWMAFGEKCSGRLGIWGHYLLLLTLPALFLLLDTVKNKYDFKSIAEAGTVWIEVVIIICLAAFLPGLLIDIAGGSAVYFSYFAEIPPLILLCGRNCLDMDKCTKRSVKILVYTAVFCWCIFWSYTNRADDPLESISGEHSSGLSGLLLDIRESADGEQEKYTVYLDDNSPADMVFDDERCACYVFPAMTGIGVINATYCQDGTCYSYRGEKAEDGYFMDLTDNEKNMTFDEALAKAKEMGKKGLIHFVDSGYEIVYTE